MSEADWFFVILVIGTPTLAYMIQLAEWFWNKRP